MKRCSGTGPGGKRCVRPVTAGRQRARMAVSATLCAPRRRKEHGDREPEVPRGLKVGELSIADQGAQEKHAWLKWRMGVPRQDVEFIGCRKWQWQNLLVALRATTPASWPSNIGSSVHSFACIN